MVVDLILGALGLGAVIYLVVVYFSRLEREKEKVEDHSWLAPEHHGQLTGAGNLRQRPQHGHELESDFSLPRPFPLIKAISPQQMSLEVRSETLVKNFHPDEIPQRRKSDPSYNNAIPIVDRSRQVVPPCIPEVVPITPLQAVVTAGLKGSKPIVKFHTPGVVYYPPPQCPPPPLPSPIPPPIASPPKVISNKISLLVSAPPPARSFSDTPYASIEMKDIRLVHVLGGGAFGQVWKGIWRGTPVAVKVISSLSVGHGDEAIHTFADEVGMLAHLRHPNICLFLGACLTPPNRILVTELVSRGSLWDALRTPNIFDSFQPPIGGVSPEPFFWPWWAIQRVLDGTCRGLVYLHSNSPPIIHRDLKSANLLLDDSFHVKVHLPSPFVWH
jgi:hypothetical protein